MSWPPIKPYLVQHRVAIGCRQSSQPCTAPGVYSLSYTFPTTSTRHTHQAQQADTVIVNNRACGRQL